MRVDEIIEREYIETMLKPKVGTQIVLTTFKKQVDVRVSGSTMGEGREHEQNITETHGKPKEPVAMEVK